MRLGQSSESGPDPVLPIPAYAPTAGSLWENKLLTERPFGPDQALVDAKAEALSPQGVNRYVVKDVIPHEGRIYVRYWEDGHQSEEPSWMVIPDFLKKFRPIVPA
jgi:hypothetical protein